MFGRCLRSTVESSSHRGAKRRAALAALCLLALAAGRAQAQGLDRGAGHCVKNGQIIFGCWNTAAGDQLPETLSYPEIQPNLDGWDFRINLPHINLQLAHLDMGSDLVLAGALEDFASLYATTPAGKPFIADYGHRNNSLWVFRVRSEDGQVYFKHLPSRRSGSVAENAAVLTAGWMRVGSLPGPRFKIEKPTVVVVPDGTGNTFYVLARAENNAVHMSKLAFFGGTPSWFEGWVPLGITSTSPIAASRAFGQQLALATFRGKPLFGYEVRLFNPATQLWSPAIAMANVASSPQLVWDGTALNGFFVQGGQVQHLFSTSSAPLMFREQVQVTNGFALANGQYHVELFNGRFHLAYLLGAADPSFNPVYYTTAYTPFGQRSNWAQPSYTGFNARSGPRVATVYDQLYVVANGFDGKPRFARKDPNKRGNNLTGGANDDRWLEAGWPADDRAGSVYGDPAVLSFNGDIYLAANRLPQGFTAGYPHLMNFSRSVMKRLATQKWGMRLTHGEPDGDFISTVAVTPQTGTKVLGDFDGDGKTDLAQLTQLPRSQSSSSPVFVSRGAIAPSMRFGGNELWIPDFAPAGEVPLAGDVNGDGMDDLVTFVQKSQSGVGNAPVWVALSNGDGFDTAQPWHTFFSLQGEIPAVGDFDGDTRADIATFTQQPQHDAAGNLLGNAPVWVALSTGSSFGGSSIWHPFFSLAGELPQVGDFNGDGRTDIVTFTQQPQHFADGSLLGQAPVWVSLSTGSSFATSTVWATDFSRAGEVPLVGDIDFDGRDDVMSFLHGQGGAGNEFRSSAAASAGNRFLAPALMMQDFAKNHQVRIDSARIVRSPAVAHIQGMKLRDFTLNPVHEKRFMPEILAFDSSNNNILFTIPARYFPSPWGAPWERYKMSLEKWVGLAMYPEWIYGGPNHCMLPIHRFAMLGRSGAATGGITMSSVHVEAREGHVVEEFGHSLFAVCLRSTADPFNIHNAIFNLSTAQGGVGAGSMPGCSSAGSILDVFGNGFYDCRDPEHYFISILIRFRLMGDTFRAQITNPNITAAQRATAKAQYLWVKNNWYQGVDFKRATSAPPGSLFADGVQCLPNECPLDPGGTIGVLQ